jgi:uncharacterized membrane protein YphA (DoxX/SURF4 family)
VRAKFYIYQPWLTLVARLILGGVLLAAGGLKIGNLQKSAMAVRAYEMLPVGVANFLGYVLPWIEIGVGLLLIAGVANFLGYVLPWIEIGLGLLLIAGVAVAISGLLGAFTMLAFIIAISQAWARGLSIDCGCFGGGGTVDPEDTKYLSEIIRDIGLLLLGIYLYYFPKGKFGLDK